MKHLLSIVFAISVSVCASISLNAQTYQVHPTKRTVRFTADNVSEYDVSDCVGGVFLVKEQNNGVSYIIDTLCNTLGALKLSSSFIPRFYGGKVATAVLKNNDIAVIDINGNVVKSFPDGYEISPYFVDGVALLRVYDTETRQDVIIYIDESGEQIYKHIEIPDGYMGLDVSPLRDGLRRYYDSQKGCYGFIDRAGNIVIPARFKKAHDFSDGLAAVTSNDGEIHYWGFIDTSGNEVIPPKFRNEPDDFHDGYAIAKKHNGKFVFIDKDGKVKTDDLSLASRFFKGYALISAKEDNGGYWTKCHVIDTEFKIIRTVESSTTCWPNEFVYDENHGTFLMGGNVYYPNGIMKLSPRQSGSIIHEFIDDVALYRDDNFWGFINSKGEVLMYFVESEF